MNRETAKRNWDALNKFEICHHVFMVVGGVLVRYLSPKNNICYFILPYLFFRPSLTILFFGERELTNDK